ncbi:hypothetical protein COB52_05895 [Candidatus Kaiserbacteria bacterium]|nr:MAG: hypothetical protein COB52_05895 [Candidatus Kaiserbacteria bacterium]
MYFYPYESIEIPRTSGLVARDKESLNTFWSEVEEIEEGLSTAIGIYIFSIRAGMGSLPWYVGKAEKRGFRKECFAHHKLTHYNESLSGRKGTPLLTLLPKLTPGHAFVQPNGNPHGDISALEKMLIGTCIQKNSDLANISDTKLRREMVVPGYINSPKGRARSSVKEFRQLLGV